MNKKTNLRILCEVAILVALEIVLTRFCSIRLQTTRIGFGFIPMALCGMLFGPFWGAAAYAVADILGTLLFPTGAYFPGFTLTAALTGATFGFFLHRKEELRFFPHMACAIFVNCVILSFGLSTLWVTLLYGSTYTARLITRIPQLIVSLSAQAVFLPILNSLSKQLRKAGITV